MSRFCRRLTAGGGLLVLLLIGLPNATAAESLDGGCPVVAAAQGVQLTVSASDNILLEAPQGAGVPVAQACVDYGVKESSGFASSPYPGATVVTTPGLLRGITNLPVPDYPAYVASRYPATPAPAGVEQQGYSLRSRSGATSSSAHARSGLSEQAGSAVFTQASAESMVDPAAGSASATASSDTEPLTINGVLQLGRVRSVATARVGRDGVLKRGSELTIGRTTVAGQTVEITPEGIKAAGQSTALPDLRDAQQSLAQAGIRVMYLRAEQVSQGVVSAGIEVRAQHQDQQTGAVYTVRYVFGRAFAAAAPPEGDAGERTDSPVPDVGPVDGGQPESVPASNGGTVAGVTVPDPARAPAAVGEALAPQTAPVQLRAAGAPLAMGAAGLYLVLGFGAIAMFVSAMLLRLVGVRTRWTD